jgi:hypothetical protein
VGRAKAALGSGAGTYRLFNNNCIHFAMRMRYGDNAVDEWEAAGQKVINYLKIGPTTTATTIIVTTTQTQNSSGEQNEIINFQ